MAVAEDKALDAPVTAPKAGSGFLLKLIMVSVLLLVFTGINIGVLWYFFGGSKPTEVAVVDGALPESPAIGDPSNPGMNDFTEVELDDYSVTNTTAAQGHTIHVSFKLIAIVSKSSQTQFELVVRKESKNRVKEAVERIIRSASMNDLKDSQLDFVKRRMREDINKNLGNSYINKIVIIEFRLMEQ